MGQEQSNSTQSNKRADKSLVGDVVVVKHGNGKNTPDQRNDGDMLKLEDIEQFYPLLRSSLNIPDMQDFDSTNKLDAITIQAISSRYQMHLKLCAEAVAFDQDALSTRLRELESISAAVFRRVSERCKMLQHQMNLIQTVEDVKQNTDKVEQSLQRIIPLMENLNTMLPETDRMEPFLKATK